MRQYLLLFIVLSALFVFTVGVVAQDSALQADTAQENACNEGGLFFRDGVSLCETEWHWECGWYIANWQNTGASVPAWCGTGHLPVAPFPGCVRGSFYYMNFGNQFVLPAHAVAYQQPDCTGAFTTFAHPLVYATSLADAEALCLSVFNSTDVGGPFGSFVYQCEN